MNATKQAIRKTIKAAFLRTLAADYEQRGYARGRVVGFIEGQIAEVKKMTERVKYDYSGDGRKEERRQAEADRNHEQERP